MLKHKTRIKDCFSKSAKDYDRWADVQYQMVDKIVGGLKREYKNILDLGSGTGILTSNIKQKFPLARIAGLDLAPGMIEFSRAKINQPQVVFLLGDAEEMPFKNHSFDLVVSSAALQWMDIGRVFIEVERVLCPGGEFYFTTFGPATLQEVKKAGLSVNPFPDQQEIEGKLNKLFKEVHFISETVAEHYQDIYALFCHLRKIGAQNPSEVKTKGLLTRNKILNIFPPGKELKITYEIYFVKCKKQYYY